jgi:catechol 2,3-dioxygenase-like lactoylglutathione lyase family enzyme
MGIPRIEGFGHIDLTVTDGERGVRWWTEVLGFRLVATFGRPGFRAWSMVHPSGVPVGLLVHEEGVGNGFDERIVGLDHFALTVRDRQTLEEWQKHLDQLGVHHSGIQEENGGPLITLRDPDNIQVELWAFDPNLVELRKGTERDLFFEFHGTTSN